MPEVQKKSFQEGTIRVCVYLKHYNPWQKIWVNISGKKKCFNHQGLRDMRCCFQNEIDLFSEWFGENQELVLYSMIFFFFLHHQKVNKSIARRFYENVMIQRLFAMTSEETALCNNKWKLSTTKISGINHSPDFNRFMFFCCYLNDEKCILCLFFPTWSSEIMNKLS